MKKIAIAVAAALGVAAASSGVTYWIARADTTGPAASAMPREVSTPREEPAPSRGAGIDAMFQEGTDRALDDQVRRQRALPAAGAGTGR